MTELRLVHSTPEPTYTGEIETPVAPVIPSNVVDFELRRRLRDNRKWLTALGCPNRKPIFEGGHLTFLDRDRTLSISPAAAGLRCLVWATAGDGSNQSSRYASFELPNEQIVSLDLQRGTDLWVSFSDSSYQEA